MVDVRNNTAYKTGERVMVCTGGTPPPMEPRENEKVVHDVREWDPDGLRREWLRNLKMEEDVVHCLSIKFEDFVPTEYEGFVPKKWFDHYVKQAGMSMFVARRFRPKNRNKRLAAKKAGLIERKKFLMLSEEEQSCLDGGMHREGNEEFLKRYRADGGVTDLPLPKMFFTDIKQKAKVKHAR